MGNVVDRLKDLISARQNNRILRLSFPNNDGPRCEFVVEKLDAFESVSRDFEFTIEILSDNAKIELKDIQGKLLSVELVQKGGTLRYFSGYCFSFRLKRAENIAFYEAKLAPWLRYLTLRKDSYLFHDANLRQQTESIFSDYGAHPVWDFKVYGDDAAMTDACQFNETDSNYLHRRWEAAGIHYYYEHDAKGHKLVLGDDSTRAAPIDGDPAVRFHLHSGAEEEDAISEWSPARFIKPASVTLRAFDFKRPQPQELSLPTLNQQGGVFNVESYEYTGAYGFNSHAAGDRLVRLRLEEMEAAGKSFEACGNNSRVVPGRWFSLVDRFGKYPFGNGRTKSINEFLIIEVRHSATNNYLQTAGEGARYSNQLTCIRKAIPWRPGRGFNSVDTKILAPQTAIVVGPEGQDSIHTDEYGRVRVQFHWDRVGVKNELSSGWVRVSSSWAGAQLGAAAVPRVGSEVIVQWLDGCPDRPIVTGCVHNQMYTPPWVLPAQRALTGLRSRELKPGGGNTEAGRSNHLILDDTNEEIQVQLKSDHQHSQLSLGHITRIENNAGRGDARGEGWELASDAWGVARAGRGMLLTTEPRPRAQGQVKGMDESIKRLAAAAALQRSLADAAHAHDIANAPGDQGAVVDAIKNQNDAIKGAGGEDAFPELSAPHLLLASPAGIETSSKKSTHVASVEHTALTTGMNLSIATGDSLLASVTNAFRVFVHKAGMRLIAAEGKVHIQAQSDDITAIAHKVLQLISEADWVDIRGKKGVRLHGADSMLEISDKVQFFTASPTLFHGNLETLAPKNRPQVGPAPPKIDAVPAVATEPEPEYLYHDLRAHSVGGQYEHVAYALYKDGAKVEDGMTDRFGLAKIAHKPGTKSYRIELGNGETFALDVSPNGKNHSTSATKTATDQQARLADDAPSSRQHD